MKHLSVRTVAVTRPKMAFICLYNENANWKGLMPMKYMTVMEAAKQWNISDRRVRFLCSQGRIRGIIQQGRRYLIPENTEKPRDERVRKTKHTDPRKYNDFTRLDLLKGMLSDEPVTSEPVPSQVDQSFLYSFAWGSSALSGSTLTLEQVIEVLEGSVVCGHPLSEHMTVVGLRDAMEYGIMSAQERKPLSQNLIRNVHSLAAMDQPMEKGRYRRVKVRLRQPDSSPVYLDLMEPRVNELLNMNTQRKKVMHPIERITRFYLEFQAIHPFEEANGRVGQVLLNLELIENGYPPIVFTPQDSRTYQSALHEFFAKQDASKMIQLVSSKLEKSMEGYLTRALIARIPGKNEQPIRNVPHSDPAAAPFTNSERINTLSHYNK